MLPCGEEKSGEGCHLCYICGGIGSRASSTLCPSVLCSYDGPSTYPTVTGSYLYIKNGTLAYTVHNESKHVTSQE